LKASILYFPPLAFGQNPIAKGKSQFAHARQLAAGAIFGEAKLNHGHGLG